MDKSEKVWRIASQMADDFAAGIRPPHGRSLRHEVKVQVSKQTGGVDSRLRKAAADLAQEIVRGDRPALVIKN